MKKLWKKGTVSDKIREYKSYDQLEDLATDYRENVIDELLTNNEAYYFGRMVAEWIAPRLKEFRSYATAFCIPQALLYRLGYHKALPIWNDMLGQMQFALETVAGINYGEVEKLKKEGKETTKSINRKVKKGLFLFAMYLEDMEY